MYSLNMHIQVGLAHNDEKSYFILFDTESKMFFYKKAIHEKDHPLHPIKITPNHIMQKKIGSYNLTIHEKIFKMYNCYEGLDAIHFTASFPSWMIHLDPQHFHK